jgi:hypothetical protein
MIHPDATIEECMEEIGALEREIERLRADNEILRAYVKHERSLGAEEPMIELTDTRQEIERLRAMLGRALGEKP